MSPSVLRRHRGQPCDLVSHYHQLFLDWFLFLDVQTLRGFSQRAERFLKDKCLKKVPEVRLCPKVHQHQHQPSLFGFTEWVKNTSFIIKYSCSPCFFSGAHRFWCWGSRICREREVIALKAQLDMKVGAYKYYMTLQSLTFHDNGNSFRQPRVWTAFLSLRATSTCLHK